MIVNYTAKYTATDMDDAIAKATTMWRDVTKRPTAELPWGATLTITQENGVKDVELVISTDITNSA